MPEINDSESSEFDGDRFSKDELKELATVPFLKPEALTSLGDFVVSLRHSPDGARIAVATADGNVTILDSRNLSIVAEIPGHNGGTLAVAWSADGLLIASGGQDGKLKVWDSSSGALRWETKPGVAWVEHVTFSPELGASARIAAAAGKSLAVWTSSGELVVKFSPHPSSVSGVDWRGSGDRLVSSCYGGIRLWSTAAVEPKRFFEWKGSPISLALDPTGRWIASGCQDSSVHVWKSQLGEDLEMSGYASKVREIAWSQDGRFLATGGGDDITVWDFSGKGPSGSEPLVRSGHAENVSALQFQPRSGSAILASIGKEGAFFLWDLKGKRKPIGLGLPARQGPGSCISWHPKEHRLVTGYASGGLAVWSTVGNS